MARRIQSEFPNVAQVSLAEVQSDLRQCLHNELVQSQVIQRFRAGSTRQTPGRAALRLRSCARWLRPVAKHASGISVVGLSQSSPISLSSREKESLLLAFCSTVCAEGQIVFRVGPIACQVVCSTSLWNGREKSTLINVAASVGQSTRWALNILVAAAKVPRSVPVFGLPQQTW